MSHALVDAPSTAPDRPTRSPAARALALWQSAGPVAVFVVLLILVAIVQPPFVTGGGLRILAVQATPIMLVALGQAMVLHVGSIDLSNAAIAILSAIVLAKALGPLGAAAPLLCLVLLTAVGAVNGLLVAFAQVPSFALTLGTLGVLQAVSLVVSHASTVYATAHTGVLDFLFEIDVFGLPIAFWVAVLLALALWLLLRRTATGRAMTAVGLNETGARFAGLRTQWLRVLAFALSGAMAAVAGIMIVAQAQSASSSGLGSDLLIPAIAAAIVGGTALTGGVTNPLNVVVGALTVSLVPIGAQTIGVTSQAQSLVYGLVIVVAVALTVPRVRSIVK
ncbi:ABC transporter permease [Nocardioides mangrovicus]|nr:ABC transporter permease [Nocardioides mangrovicus]